MAIGMYDQGGGLLEKLQQLGIAKLKRLLPEAGAAIGYGLGGPAGGYAGQKIGGGLESILEAGLAGGQQDQYGNLGMSPQGIGLEGMNQPGMMEMLAQQGAQGLGQMAGEGMGAGLGSLAGLSGMEGMMGAGQQAPMGGGMDINAMLQDMLRKMPEEEIMKILESRRLSGSYQ